MWWDGSGRGGVGWDGSCRDGLCRGWVGNVGVGVSGSCRGGVGALCRVRGGCIM